MIKNTLAIILQTGIADFPHANGIELSWIQSAQHFSSESYMSSVLWNIKLSQVCLCNYYTVPAVHVARKNGATNLMCTFTLSWYTLILMNHTLNLACKIIVKLNQMQIKLTASTLNVLVWNYHLFTLPSGLSFWYQPKITFVVKLIYPWLKPQVSAIFVHG